MQPLKIRNSQLQRQSVPYRSSQDYQNLDQPIQQPNQYLDQPVIQPVQQPYQYRPLQRQMYNEPVAET